MRRALAALTVLALAGPAMADAPELPAGVYAVPIQSGEVIVLREDGQPDSAPTTIPAGYWTSIPGRERLMGYVAQCQADAQAERARAEALQASLALVPPRSSGGVSTGMVVLVGVTLLLAGGFVGYSLGRR